MQEPERVFLSYSHESGEHDALVLSLAGQLRADGVLAFCDLMPRGTGKRRKKQPLRPLGTSGQISIELE